AMAHFCPPARAVMRSREWSCEPGVGRMLLVQARRTEQVRLARGRAAAGLAVGTASIIILGLSVGAITVRSRAGAGAAPVGPPPPPAVLQVEGDQGGVVAWDQPLRLRAVNGTLDDVTVTDDAGATVTGLRSLDGRSWASSSALVPLVTYTIEADLVDRLDQHSLRSAVVKASDARDHLRATISPGD